jgi:uncharacterized protein YqcC (DUF446 family)
MTGSDPPPLTARHRGAAERADAIEAELRRIGRWQAEPPAPEAFESRQAFFGDTMALEQWLQFVLLPRVRDIVARGGAFPAQSQVGAYALRNFDGDAEAQGLVQILLEFDRHVTGAEDEGLPPPKVVSPVAEARAGDEVAAAVEAYRRERFPGEVTAIRAALGAAVEVEVDWASLARGVPPERRLTAARQWLPSRGVGDLRAALCLLEGTYGDSARAAVAAALKRIRLRNVAPGEPEGARLADGTLEVAVCLARGGVRTLDVGRVLVDGLGLRVGPALERLRREAIPGHQGRLEEQLDAPVVLDLDVASFLAEPDGERRLAALHDCDHHGLYALTYALGAVAAAEPWRTLARARVTVLRVRHVADAAERALGAEGSAIVLAGRFGDAGGTLGAAEIEALLPGVLAGMPGLPAGGDDPLAAARRAAAEAQGRLAAVLGAPVTLDVDWDALAAAPGALDGLVPRALQRAVGGLALLERALGAAPAGARPHTVRIRDVRDAAEQGCRLEDGVLDVRVRLSPGGEALYERDIAAAVSDRLGLETLPLVASLREEMLPRAQRALREALGTTIAVDVEWDGFLTGAPVDRQTWALRRLEEEGLDWLRHALAAVAGRGEDLARLVRRRVGAIRVQHVDRPDGKALLARGRTLVLRLHLHEGYAGRLTIDEMRRRLPGLLAEMDDAPDA